MPGYGPIDGSVVIQNITITVEKRQNVTRYVRKNEEVVEKNIVGAKELVLVPMYPVFTPKQITSYVLILFEKPLYIAPNEQITIYTLMPVEIAIYAYSSTNNYTLIDVFSVERPKYTLYGPIDHGVIARYYRSRFWFTEREPNAGEALVKVIARNRSREWVSVNKILLDCNPLKLYYRKNTWHAYTQEIALNIVTASSANITYNKPFKEDVEPINDPPGLKQPIVYMRSDMLWGI